MFRVIFHNAAPPSESGLTVTAAGNVLIVFLSEKAFILVHTQSSQSHPPSVLDVSGERRKEGGARKLILSWGMEIDFAVDMSAGWRERQRERETER